MPCALRQTHCSDHGRSPVSVDVPGVPRSLPPLPTRRRRPRSSPHLPIPNLSLLPHLPSLWHGHDLAPLIRLPRRRAPRQNNHGRDGLHRRCSNNHSPAGPYPGILAARRLLARRLGRISCPSSRTRKQDQSTPRTLPFLATRPPANIQTDGPSSPDNLKRRRSHPRFVSRKHGSAFQTTAGIGRENIGIGTVAVLHCAKTWIGGLLCVAEMGTAGGDGDERGYCADGDSSGGCFEAAALRRKSASMVLTERTASPTAGHDQD